METRAKKEKNGKIALKEKQSSTYFSVRASAHSLPHFLI